MVNNWYNRMDVRLLRNFINEPNIKRTFYLLRKSRHELRLITAYLTGHGPFKSHLKRMKLISDATCRFCNLDDETAERILCECEALAFKRQQILGLGFPRPSEYHEVDLETLLIINLGS